ncbi:MAG TPA: hypothetical protein VMU26_01600 [Candidatus Polarisedimenticolia bacterium]|nr:hypothetical protein [Candidatus Polarisedimenticolia bacterium]
MRKGVRRISYAFLTVLLLALLGGFTYEQVGRAGDASQLPPRVGQAVDIGGRTLNLYCSGNGMPTVVLETGGNSPGYSLLLQQSKMAVFTRACWYDRAGVGWSDPRRLHEPVRVLRAICTRCHSVRVFCHLM